MAITNRERIGKGLDHLARGLRPFVEREMKSSAGDHWLSLPGTAGVPPDTVFPGHAPGGPGPFSFPFIRSFFVFMTFWDRTIYWEIRSSCLPKIHAALKTKRPCLGVGRPARQNQPAGKMPAPQYQ